MKRLGSAIGLLFFLAVPLEAAVSLSCSQSGSTSTSATFTVSYSYDGVGSAPRAFALDITTSVGTIAGVTAAKTGESTSASKGFGIFPSTIVIDTAAGTVTSFGSPISPNAKLPSGTLGGIGTGGVTVELGSLYADSTGKPASSGVLLTVKVTLSAGATATFNVTDNAARGGIVLEDATTVTASSTCIIPPRCECFSNALSTYARWVSSGAPSCWCPLASVTGLPTGGTGYQCVGDAAQDKYPGLNYRVYSSDLTALSNSWKKRIGDVGYNACADVDHAAYPGLNYGVYSGDLTRLSTFWKKTDAQLNVILGIGTTGGWCGQATVPAAYR